MQQVYPHTAIFIFTRDAAAEASSKHLSCRGREENRALIREMNTETGRIARATGLPVFRMNGELKPGESFGEKLRSAFLRVFEAGFRNVIGIGNDCPALSASRLLVAARHLEKHAFVLGPARDGGVYLIGAQKGAFCNVPVTELPWKTTRLFASMLVEWSGYSIHCLQPESDLDNRRDLYRLLNSTKANAFKRALAMVLSSQKEAGDCIGYEIKEQGSTREVSLRGPPIAA